MLIEGTTQVSATSKKSINPRWRPVVILNYAESFSETDIIICTGLIWLIHANIISYHKTFGSFPGIVIIGVQCVPGVYLLFLAAILDLASRWTPKHNFNARNGFVALKLVGLDVMLSYLCYIGQNLGIPQIQVILAAILDLASGWTPKHNFNARNGFVALKLVGLEVLLYSLCYIGQNLGIPQIQDGHRTPSWITKKPTQRMIENHRFWTPSTFKQLSWKKWAF